MKEEGTEDVFKHCPYTHTIVYLFGQYFVCLDDILFVCLFGRFLTRKLI